MLSPGYNPVPVGMLASVVTSLEMKHRPASRPTSPADGAMVLERMVDLSVEHYRRLFRAVGEDWLWFSRLIMPDAQLTAILDNPDIEIYTLRTGSGAEEREIGLLELDFRGKAQCELAFFGLVKDAIGQGAGRYLMNRALDLAWSRPIERLWVHTCSFDHPSALAFYRRSGFVPCAFQIEVSPDPRLSGHLPQDAAAHVPLADFSDNALSDAP